MKLSHKTLNVLQMLRTVQSYSTLSLGFDHPSLSLEQLNNRYVLKLLRCIVIVALSGLQDLHKTRMLVLHLKMKYKVLK